MSIYQHFRPEEKEFIDQVLNWKDTVESSYAPKLTDFLDPREQFIVQSIVGQDAVCRVMLYGGTENTERKRALIYPDYFTPEHNDFDITLFEVEYPDKFVSIEHPKLLGSLMGLGLRRGKFGDILLSEKKVQFFVAKEISEYVRLNLHAIGKTTVTLAEKNLENAISIHEEWSEMVVIVSSLRLDTVLSAISRLSRQKALTLIQQGLVKVNWKMVDQAAFQLHEGDIISARGIGRIKLISVGDKTKKDKWKITAGKIK